MIPQKTTPTCCHCVTWLVPAGAYQKAAEAAETELHEFLAKATDEIDSAIGYDTKAVFVTFNTEKQRDDCLAACPQREWRLPKEGGGEVALLATAAAAAAAAAAVVTVVFTAAAVVAAHASFACVGVHERMMSTVWQRY
jgi:hypothetical protein